MFEQFHPGPGLVAVPHGPHDATSEAHLESTARGLRGGAFWGLSRPAMNELKTRGLGLHLHDHSSVLRSHLSMPVEFVFFAHFMNWRRAVPLIFFSKCSWNSGNA